MMKEQDIQRSIIKYLEGRGYYVVKIVSASKRGVPDILACGPDGRFVAIEVKLPGKVPSKLQQFNLDRIREAGGIAFAATSVDDVKKALDL